MTTPRQRHPSAQEQISRDASPSSAPAAGIPSSIVVTLLGFTVGMIVLPLGTYFVTINSLFNGNATLAGASAAAVANLVLVGYVYLAWREDQAEFAQPVHQKKAQ
ncbi:hypothetical protein BT63DRAFT_449653 [Microthyrium microscopicum]|uniref:Uncharacterized protein n=1 Tax=Microthyrium microscopicum TaxID=703497 RepID=A0A6A6UUP7_9PEZI|nr:hypothetical protein BT63DRAFT_449653 [Microthyrium microscopicum]